MKYLRTKYKVYDETKVDLIADAMTGEIFVEKMIDGYTSHLDQVIKKADTIEELCDYLMFVDNNEKEDILITDVNEVNITYSKNETCYACLKIKLPNGAIRIEPIAKFNEKWSFELI